MAVTEKEKREVVAKLLLAEASGEDVRKKLWHTLRSVCGETVDEVTLAKAAKEMHAEIRASVERLEADDAV